MPGPYDHLNMPNPGWWQGGNGAPDVTQTIPDPPPQYPTRPYQNQTGGPMNGQRGGMGMGGGWEQMLSRILANPNRVDNLNNRFGPDWQSQLQQRFNNGNGMWAGRGQGGNRAPGPGPQAPVPPAAPAFQMPPGYEHLTPQQYIQLTGQMPPNYASQYLPGAQTATPPLTKPPPVVKPGAPSVPGTGGTSVLAPPGNQPDYGTKPGGGNPADKPMGGAATGGKF